MSVDVFIRLEVDINQLPQLLNQLKGQLASFPHQIEIIGDGQASGNGEPAKAQSFQERGEKLPIDLFPPDEELFKKKLLVSKKAEITTYFMDGNRQTKTWNANSFTAKSGVLNNLRTRAEFRNREWQARGIERVEVKALEQQ